MEKSTIRDYIRALEKSPKFGSQIVCHRILEPCSPSFKSPDSALDERVTSALEKSHITDLYAHQAEAVDLIAKHRDLVVATPTASGKSLIYNIPILQHYLSESPFHALYLFPLKALAQDQMRVLTALYGLVGPDPKKDKKTFCAVYDGDTKPAQRTRLRKKTPPVIITNPDMVHLSLLAYHDGWSGFFRNLRYVVIDEIHTYRGLFGSHMAWVLRRLIRLAEYYGASPRFIMLSATVGNPAELGEKLIGRPVDVITRSGAPAGRKHILFLNPWDSAAHTASQLLEAAVKRGLRTIVYTKSRKMTELITMWTKPRIGALADRLRSYRAGFLPEERRAIERSLATGELLGVISTSALELGIDIGDLDLCILIGYPGSVMATWQRGGRVGRRSKESAVIMVGGEDALDQHFMKNPDDFFNREPEHAALNPFNQRISRQHLHCAAAESPLEASEVLLQGAPELLSEVEFLTEKSILHRDADKTCWYASRKKPQNLVGLRGGGVQMSIIDQQSGEIIGEIDAGRALKETHPGSIYLHSSTILEVQRLDLEAREVVVHETKSTYHTRAKVHKETEILERRKSTTVFGCRVSWGRLKVTEQVLGYAKISNHTMKVISTYQLELPEQIIETEGLWLDLEDYQRRLLEDSKMHFMGAIHAIEHAMIAMFPLLVLCDRNDIGGISCPHHEQTGRASIFIYDGYDGGAGLSEAAYNQIDDLIKQTLKTVSSCGCELGCPSCVHSPKCGSGNRPIDKAACLYLLEQIVDHSDNCADRDDPLTDQPVHTPRKQEQQDSGPSIEGLACLPENYCVFDLETKRSAEEVGGWGRAERMGMSVGVVYDARLDGFATYFEDEVDGLIDHLQRSDLVVGFNNRRFDYRVLSGYTRYNLYQLPTLDLLEEIYNQLGYRLSLDRLAKETLGSQKTGDGLQALAWFKEGKLKEIADYCREDVKLTRNLLLHAVEHSFLLFRNKAGKSVRLPLNLAARIAQLTDAG